MENIGLVLQGGGMRGVYTSGVLDFFMEKNLRFPYVIGVSAGACNGAIYMSNQKGMGKRVHINYVKDKRYMGLNNLYKDGSFFGMDFIFDEIPNKLEKFDYDTFYSSKGKFLVVATDCNTGKPVYYSKDDHDDIFKMIRGSSSIPLISKMVEFNGSRLLDGGISDPIPIEKSIADGNEKNIVVLTENIGLHRKKHFLCWLESKLYKGYMELCNTIHNGHNIFNKTMDTLNKLKNDKKVIVIEPSVDIKLKVTGRNISKLHSLYKIGYRDAELAYDEISNMIKS